MSDLQYSHTNIVQYWYVILTPMHHRHKAKSRGKRRQGNGKFCHHAPPPTVINICSHLLGWTLFSSCLSEDQVMRRYRWVHILIINEADELGLLLTNDSQAWLLSILLTSFFKMSTEEQYGKQRQSPAVSDFHPSPFHLFSLFSLVSQTTL